MIDLDELESGCIKKTDPDSPSLHELESIVRELRAARECVKELRYARPRHPGAARALAAYDEACK